MIEPICSKLSAIKQKLQEYSKGEYTGSHIPPALASDQDNRGVSLLYMLTRGNCVWLNLSDTFPFIVPENVKIRLRDEDDEVPTAGPFEATVRDVDGKQPVYPKYLEKPFEDWTADEYFLFSSMHGRMDNFAESLASLTANDMIPALIIAVRNEAASALIEEFIVSFGVPDLVACWLTEKVRDISRRVKMDASEMRREDGKLLKLVAERLVVLTYEASPSKTERYAQVEPLRRAHQKTWPGTASDRPAD